MSTMPAMIKPGTAVNIRTKYDGVKPAVLMAASDGRVLVLFEERIQINSRGERSTWAWCPLERLSEVIE